TGTAFGSLVLSSHPGTASMGKLLALARVFTLVAAFFVVPAFLGPPPKRPDPKRPEGGDAGSGCRPAKSDPVPVKEG
ncbi:hypothetical protein, partial [Methylobacterium sp. E-045]|uniref:hypothetical protein n=1 Tax=Methylobacterium sp. E-045 TaxID=2836575 RepID=UPI001FB99D4C